MTNEPQTFGQLPQSDALREANPESLRDILERAPSTLTEDILRKQVEALRAHRERLDRGELKPQRQKAETKAIEAKAQAKSVSLGELDF